MAEIINNWLKNEIELSKNIENFEADFANGYLFGELLFKFNQQPNFKEFSKANTVAAKQQNFQKLLTSFHSLGIKQFNSLVADQIINQKKGIALQFLYQLKMALENVYPPTDIKVLQKTGKMGDNQPAMKIVHSKEKYDTLNNKLFSNRLQAMSRPQKAINMDRHQQKFEDERQRQQEQAKKDLKEAQEESQRIKAQLRTASINKLIRNGGFMEEWQQKGVDDWKVNQTIKKDRERKDLEFQYKQATKYNKLAMTKVEEANKEVHQGIAGFEQTLRSKGINPRVNWEDAQQALYASLTGQPLKASPLKPLGATSQSLKLSQTGFGQTIGGDTFKESGFGLGTQGGVGRIPQNMMTKTGGITLTSTGLKTKDKKTVTEQTRKERERRRRKMIVDQNKTYSDMEHKKRENQIIERMNRKAKQEEQLVYEQWRTIQCKNVITENRKLREARYDKRRELDQQNSIMREEEMLASMKEQMAREMNTLKERDVETRIVHKQAKRLVKTDYAGILFDAIFDIANEAYVHQQKSDSSEIDNRNWHEWLQLFIQECPITGTLEKAAQLHENIQNEDQQNDQEEEAQLELSTSLTPQDQLDQVELIDYLTNNGQWNTDLVTLNKPNLEQFLTGQMEATAPTGAKGGKGAPAKAAIEQIQLEEGDTDLPESAPNNFILGDAIENIINLNYEDRPHYKRPKVPHYLQLKLCLVGYSFTGKNTVAQKLMEELGLQIFRMGDLVHEALSYYEDNPQPINADGVVQMVEEYNGDVSEDSELNEDYNALEEFRLCGAQIKNILVDGQEISDDLYVQLFIAKLRFAFVHKNKKQLRYELKMKVEKQQQLLKQLDELTNEDRQLTQVNESPKKKRKLTAEQVQNEIQNIRDQLVLIDQIDQNGWVLVDFPSNFAQAKLLEAALSGYIPQSEHDPIQREKEIKEALLLVQPNAKEAPPNLLIKSGVDAVIWMKADREECLRRALGRRWDNLNEKMYHIEEQPPLTTSAPLCERLQTMDQEENSESTMVEKWVAFDENSKGLSNWLKKFGDSESDMTIYQEINANLNEEQVYNQVKQIVENIKTLKQAKQNQKMQQIADSILSKQQEDENIKQQENEQNEIQQKLDDNQGEQIKQEVKNENKVLKPDQISDKIPPKQPDLENVDQDFRPVVLKLWQDLCYNYKVQMKKSFGQIRGQRERMINQQAYLQKRFLTFLHRADSKQEKLEQFINDFNEFTDQFVDLREDDQTKEELHKRVDILSDELWEITEDRKDQNIEERKKIMESGWIEHELQFTVECAQKLMQTEVDKFRHSVQILHDYYHTYEDKLIPESPQVITGDIIGEGEDLPPIESIPEGADPMHGESYTYPRLDKIYEKALKCQVVLDVTQNQAIQTDKKGAVVKGKDQKKPTIEEEKPAEESQYIKQMKEAIKVEKATLRFRLTLIRNWAQKNLREMRQKCQKMYHKLEDWILVTVKTENEAINEMCIIIKDAIESEQKIMDELRIKFMDFCVDQKIMNYIEPPPEKLPAMEQILKTRFTIKQLNSLVKEMEEIAYQQGSSIVPNKLIIDLLMRRLENSRTLGDENGLPESWSSFNEYDFQLMIRNLDKYNQGAINWKQLATCICLLQSNIATEKDADNFTQSSSTLKDSEGFIDEQSFVQIKTWFDDTEQSQDRDGSIHFPRVKHIKHLLYRIFKDQNENKLHIKKFLTIAKAKELIMFKRGVKTYDELLFANIEK